MINLQKKTIDELLEIKRDLNFFINKTIVATIYHEEGKDPIELELDREQARTLLEKVNERLGGLGKQIVFNRAEETSDSTPLPPEPTESSSTA